VNRGRWWGRSCLVVDHLVVDRPIANHRTIVRQTGEMIGKLDRDQRSGVRDQKKNDLGARWAAFEMACGLDKKRQGSRAVGTSRLAPGSPRFLSPGSQVPILILREAFKSRSICALPS
jgi:hypothetical protein